MTWEANDATRNIELTGQYKNCFEHILCIHIPKHITNGCLKYYDCIFASEMTLFYYATNDI